MIAKIISGAIIGVEGYTVMVEADLSPGMPGMDIVGLPDSAVKESRERVRTAVKNTGYQLPIKRITINLAPADIRKEGPSFDLPIAVGILCGMGVIPAEKTRDVFMTGELSLDGGIRPVSGVLPMVYGAFKNGYKICIVPDENSNEAALVEGAEIIPVKSLKDIIEHFTKEPLKPYKPEPDVFKSSSDMDGLLDFSDVKGQENVKRALTVAAAGMHNALMLGPPGSGKTMLAKRIPTILNDLSFEESIDVTKIYSVAGLIRNREALVTRRPFRAPHHTISYSALVGGGKIPKPGEISLAHNGVLFLDELPEFQKNVLEVLRQPMEDGSVTISRVHGTITYPSGFMLIASMNPCPCGYYGDRNKCSCSQPEISRYLSRISGPLLDRIDIQTEAPKVDYAKLQLQKAPESSADIKSKVVAAQNIQRERYINDGILYNSQLTSPMIDKYCALDAAGRAMLKQAFDILGLSARAYHKILKVTRTVADLDGGGSITERHLAEAIQYRNLDRKYWA